MYKIYPQAIIKVEKEKSPISRHLNCNKNKNSSQFANGCWMGVEEWELNDSMKIFFFIP